jgi:glucose-1-phosphate cytidylyltransferase
MKTVILAGGLGTRLAEETDTIPKPMVEIGDHPILWHIMKHYSVFGHGDFVIGLGYRGDLIKRWFLERATLEGDVTISVADGRVESHSEREPWTVDLIETGRDTNTGGRVKRMASHLGQGTFMLTYGDGVANIDLDALLAYHHSHGRLATISAVRPPSRFGAIAFKDDGSVSFSEKPQMGEGWINGGFMVLEPGVLDYIEGDETSLESVMIERLSGEGQLMAYQHGSFWQCMDTLRELRYLRNLWDAGRPPWVTWE